jgi:hypothetical protein
MERRALRHAWKALQRHTAGFGAQCEASRGFAVLAWSVAGKAGKNQFRSLSGDAWEIFAVVNNNTVHCTSWSTSYRGRNAEGQAGIESQPVVTHPQLVVELSDHRVRSLQAGKLVSCRAP